MNLVHNIHPLADSRRGIYRLVPQGADLIHAIVGGGVQLQHIQDGTVFDPQAGRALIAGVPIYRMLTVHRPGQDLGAGGLSRSTGTSKKIGMGKPACFHLAFQRIGDMGLANHIIKGTGPPFSV